MSAYLDHAATTPMAPEAFEAMLPWVTERFGNASGSHFAARAAKAAVEDAREEVAVTLGCRPAEVVFTSGGTEADNLAIAGVDGVAVCSAVEHHAVLRPTVHRRGTVVAVDQTGRVDLDRLRRALTTARGVGVVSVMLANNETGVVQPLAEVAAVVADAAPGAVLHTDAVQAVSWLDVAALAAPAHLVSVSAHKFGGPQGVGALVVRAGTTVRPQVLGGGQEQGRRSGTLPVAAIVGMAAALTAAVARRGQVVARAMALRQRLLDAVRAGVPDVVETAAGATRTAGVLHLCLPGVDSEELLFLMDEAGVAASAGSSCASGAVEPSHVLTAMGIPAALARGAVRLSLGWTSTEADVDVAAKALVDAVARLRGA